MTAFVTEIMKRRAFVVLGIALLTALLAFAIACGGGDDDDDDASSDPGGTPGPQLTLSQYAESFCGAFTTFSDDLSAIAREANNDTEAFQQLQGVAADFVSTLNRVTPPGEMKDWHEQVIKGFEGIVTNPNANPTLPDPPDTLIAEFDDIEACTLLRQG